MAKKGLTKLIEFGKFKEALLHPKVREVFKGFPDDVRQEMGQLIFELQKGVNLSMPQSRPMPIVALGVSEIRIRGRDGHYRAFYVTKYRNLVIVFHAFVKKTEATPKEEIELARKRLKEALEE